MRKKVSADPLDATGPPVSGAIRMLTLEQCTKELLPVVDRLTVRFEKKCWAACQKEGVSFVHKRGERSIYFYRGQIKGGDPL